METADTRSLSANRPHPFLSGIVLAAGTSQRLQQSAPPSSAAARPIKQLLDFRGRPLLQYAIEQIVRAKLDELVIVLGYEAERIQRAITLPTAHPAAHRATPAARPESTPSPADAPHDSAVHNTNLSDTFGDQARGASRTARGPVRFVVNPDFARGQSSSLHAGLRALDPRAQAAAIFLGDQPGLDARTIDSLIAKFLELGAGLAPASSQTSQTPCSPHALTPLIVRPMYWDPAQARPAATNLSCTREASLASTPGHPVLFSRAAWEEWEALRTLEGDQGARAIFATRPEWLHEIEIAALAPCDIDTWQDYQRAVDVACEREIITSNE